MGNGHLENDSGFKARAMVDPHEGTVHSLTTREEGAKRGKLVATPVRIISEEHYQQMASVHNDLIKNARRSAEVMNELAIDHGRHEGSPHSNFHEESPRRDRVSESSGIEGWNKACDETIVRHHERRKALSDYHDKERAREDQRRRGGISRALVDTIETLEAVLETRPLEADAPTIDQVATGKEMVIKITIPELSGTPFRL